MDLQEGSLGLCAVGAARLPEDVATCVIHNDFKLDNLVLSPDLRSVVGVLDWEMATLGDPLMDLAGSMAYWVQASDDPVARALRLQPTHTPGMLSRRARVHPPTAGWRSSRTPRPGTRSN